MLEFESGSCDAGIGIRIGIKVFLGNTGIRIESLATGIGMGIGIMDFGKPWNLNRKQPYWNRSLNMNQKKNYFWDGIGMRITCHSHAGLFHFTDLVPYYIVIRKH